MNVSRFGHFLFGSLLVVPVAQAHPGHQSDDGGLLASIVHSFMSVDHVLFLLAMGVGFGLWIVTRRITRRLGITRVGG